MVVDAHGNGSRYETLRLELDKIRIGPDEATTLVPLPASIFTTTTPAPRVPWEERTDGLREAGALIVISIFILILPRICLKSRTMSRIISPYLRYYCVFMVIAYIFILAYALQRTHLRLSSLFLTTVKVIEVFIGSVEEVLFDVFVIILVIALYSFRSRVQSLLGVEHQLIRADWRDLVTCFSFSRFEIIELAIWKVEDLPPTWGNTRTVYFRIIHGFNEVMNLRPVTLRGDVTSFVQKDTIQLNYDPEDVHTKLSIILKRQEIISDAVATNIAPVTGAITGAITSAVIPFGFLGGLVTGATVATGAANSGEVARLDLSTMMINRMLEQGKDDQWPQNAWRTTLVAPSLWTDPDAFHVLHLVPQGKIYFRIRSVVHAEV